MSHTSNFDQLVESLPTLSNQQVTALSTRLKALQSLSNGHSETTCGKRDIESRVLSCICEVLRDTGCEFPSVEILRRSVHFSAFVKKLPDLIEFVSQAGDSRIIQDALLKVGLDLLYWDMVNWHDATVSAYTLMQHIHRVPATLNKHFPGYSSSGCLGWIVREK